LLFSERILRIKKPVGDGAKLQPGKLIWLIPLSHPVLSRYDSLQAFKGTLSWDFRHLVFFQHSNPPSHLINRLNPSCILRRIRQDNRFESRQNRHSGVIDSAVQIWLRCDFWRHLCEALATFKGNKYRKNMHRPIVLHHTYKFSHTKNRRLQIRCSRRILIHIEKGFNPCPRGLGGVVWWKKPEVENLVSGSL
jgi:hypothetical protein